MSVSQSEMTSLFASAPRNSIVDLRFLCLVLLDISSLKKTIKERLLSRQPFHGNEENGTYAAAILSSLRDRLMDPSNHWPNSQVSRLRYAGSDM